MILNKENMKFIRIDSTWKGKPDLITRIEIDTSHIAKNTVISSDSDHNNEEATRHLSNKLSGHEFKDEDVLIEPLFIGNERNGYIIWFRMDWCPVLKGWAETFAQALMIKDWIVKSK